MPAIPVRRFGATDLVVPALGLGAGQLGDPALPEEDAARLLHAAVDLGATLIDTARSYGLSEQRIGRHLGARRGRVVLSTKLGYGVDGMPDWTGPCVQAGVDAALARLRTDAIDIVHLHSCPRETLRRGDVVDALAAAVRAGKVRVAAYSGDNDALAWAVACDRFQSVQCSVSLCDQAALHTTLPDATARGLGVIAKRPVANAPWRFDARPTGDDCETYWDRWRALQAAGLDPGELDWHALALRFTAFTPGVHCAIVGTRSPAHLQASAEALSLGPLPEGHLTAIARAWREVGTRWPGKI